MGRAGAGRVGLCHMLPPSACCIGPPLLPPRCPRPLNSTDFEGFSADETVRVVMSGNQEPRSVDITQEAYDQVGQTGGGVGSPGRRRLLPCSGQTPASVVHTASILHTAKQEQQQERQQEQQQKRQQEQQQQQQLDWGLAGPSMPPCHCHALPGRRGTLPILPFECLVPSCLLFEYRVWTA